MLASRFLSVQNENAFLNGRLADCVSRESYESKYAECGMKEALLREAGKETERYKAAENIVFMYSLVESCKMNGLDFGLYM